MQKREDKKKTKNHEKDEMKKRKKVKRKERNKWHERKVILAEGDLSINLSILSYLSA